MYVGFISQTREFFIFESGGSTEGYACIYTL